MHNPYRELAHPGRVITFLLLGLLFFDGCTAQPPKRFVDGVPWVAQQRQVQDAKTQQVREMPCLRMDAALLDRLDAAIAEEDLSTSRNSSMEILDEGHMLALQSAENELARLDEPGWRELTLRYFGSDIAPSNEVKQVVVDEFRRQTTVQVWFMEQRLQAAPDVAGVRAVMVPVRQGVQTSVKNQGRFGRAAPLVALSLPAAIARDAIHDDEAQCQMDHRFDQRVDYVPGDSSRLSASMPHLDLLVRNAPIFVQETAKHPTYSARADEIGTVIAADDATIDIDTNHPAVYAYARVVMLNGKAHVQLYYAIWYSEHPKLRKGVDPEAGHIDGATIRVTLDSQMRPAIYETLNNCGCHHRIYPTETVEEAAKAEYVEPIDGKLYCVERDVKDKYDLIIPKLIQPDDSQAKTPRAIVRCGAGTHAVVDVDFVQQENDGPVVDTREYTLLPYDDLERLTTPSGRVVSMFLPNGLVRGAERLEGDLFKPLGMLSAGQPRQRGTQLIQWDQYDFDDPRLLEKTLRLPSQF